MGGYLSKQFDTAKDIPDLTGKVAVVTGANTGLGYATALLLAQHGAKVYLTARSAQKGTDAVARMEAALGLSALGSGTGSARVNWLLLDLASVRASKAAAEAFAAREGRLDVLVNNAAETGTPYGETEEGISTIMASNHLGHFVFTTTLLPLLERTAKEPGSDVRVVNVSSEAHTYAPPSTFTDVRESFCNPCQPAGARDTFWTQMARYGQSKLANILFTKELQRRWDDAGVRAITLCLHPGGVATDGAKAFLGALYPLIGFYFVPPAKAAATPLFAATSPKVQAEREKYKAQYLTPYEVVARPSANAGDMQAARSLWELSERAVWEIEEKGRVQ